MRLASLSKPTEAIPTNARSPCARSRLADDARGRSPAASRAAIVAHAASGVVGDAQHPREVVAAPAGEHAQHRARDIRAGRRRWPRPCRRRSSATTVSPARGGLTRELAGVVEVARVYAATPSGPWPRSACSTAGATLAGLAAARGRVDDQAIRGAHRASLAYCRRAPTARGRAAPPAGGRAGGCGARRGRAGAARPRRGSRARRSRRTGRAGCRGARPSPPNGSETARRCPRPRASSTMISRMISRMPRTRARMPAEAGGTSSPIARSANSWRPLGGRLPEALDGVLEVAGAAFGERQRGVGHAPDLHPLLWPRGGDRALEVAARGVGVEALGGARAEDRQRGRLVFRLGLELLVGALLERLDGLERAALLHPNLALFGGHRPPFYGLGGRGAPASAGGAPAAVAGRDAQPVCSPGVRHRPRRQATRLRSAWSACARCSRSAPARAAPAVAASELGAGSSFNELNRRRRNRAKRPPRRPPRPRAPAPNRRGPARRPSDPRRAGSGRAAERHRAS